MIIIKLFPFLLSMFFILNCDGDLKTEQSEQNNNKPDQILLNNKYLRTTKNNKGSIGYEILQKINVPIFIEDDDNFIEGQDIATISYDKFSKNKYLLLPTNNSFFKHFSENPFKDVNSINTVRPSIWGHSLELIKIDDSKDVALFAINDEIKQLEYTELNDHPDFIKITEENLLGKGGQGKVYRITFNDKDYALKINANEAYDMERLLFTNAVAKVFGSYKIKNKKYMLMELGKESLHAMDKEKRKLTDDQVKDAISRFKHLVEVQKKLQIVNDDIKPDNLLITKDDRLVVIDISAAITKGYSGTTNELLASAILSNKLQEKMTGGYITLDRYFEFDKKKYRDHNVMSPYLFEIWLQKNCQNIPKDHDKCKDVKDFNDLFALLSQEKLLALGRKINLKYNDNSGTHDDVNYAPSYKTGLPLPNIQEVSDEDWQGYFNNKDQIHQHFCTYINQKQNSNTESLPTGKDNFFLPLVEKYKGMCQKNKETSLFTDKDDPQFRQWIKDALLPSIKLNTFEQLARDVDFRKTVDYLSNYKKVMRWVMPYMSYIIKKIKLHRHLICSL